MFTPFAKFLCAAAFASVALAQGISIALPTPGTSVRGGTSFVVQVERPVRVKSVLNELSWLTITSA